MANSSKLFFKYHALGNDYIVLEASEVPTPAQVERICHRNFGVGSDGILMEEKQTGADFGLRIFNPDGSEAEKSGNGIRIFARYLFDQKRVSEKPFSVRTKGGLVRCQILNGGAEVDVEMGSVSFQSEVIPVVGRNREVLQEKLELKEQTFEFSAATVGNPHCVILRDKVSEAETKRFGSEIEHHPNFPNRTNVQFLQIIDRNNIRIEIWERGAGYTLASGSSSSAAAAVAHRLGLCDSDITVHMPGGKIRISIGENFSIRMLGGVTQVASGTIYEEMLAWK